MDGQVQVHSALGAGTRVTVTLPLPPAARAPAPVRAERPREALPLAGVRVLLAEDVPTNQVVASGMLRRLGCEVTVAADGEAAVARIEGHDVVLMDCQMPNVDGYEATRRLRAAGCTLPIVAVTANVTDADRSACAEAGMDGFLSKPLEMNRLREELVRILGR